MIKTHHSPPATHHSIDIDHVAKLANLSLSPAEKKTFEKQLGEILDYFNHLEKVNTTKVQAIGHPLLVKSENAPW